MTDAMNEPTVELGTVVPSFDTSIHPASGTSCGPCGLTFDSPEEYQQYHEAKWPVRADLIEIPLFDQTVANSDEEWKRKYAEVEKELFVIRTTLNEVHQMMTELMPAARQAAHMLEKRNSLLKLVTGGKR